MTWTTEFALARSSVVNTSGLEVGVSTFPRVTSRQSGISTHGMIQDMGPNSAE